MSSRPWVDDADHEVDDVGMKMHDVIHHGGEPPNSIMDSLHIQSDPAPHLLKTVFVVLLYDDELQ